MKFEELKKDGTVYVGDNGFTYKFYGRKLLAKKDTYDFTHSYMAYNEVVEMDFKPVPVKLDPIPWWEAHERMLAGRLNGHVTRVLNGVVVHYETGSCLGLSLHPHDIAATWYPGRTNEKGEVI